MLNELMLAQQIETMQRLHLAWIEFEAQPDLALPPSGVRHAIASGLVRLGTMLDRTANDAQIAHKEAHHAA
jgi:hypothetical protein